MVVGNGLMASAFIKDYAKDDKFIIFASGVSNSLETNPCEFKREEELLVKTLADNPEKEIVYFTSFIDSKVQKSKYAQHKIKMEEIVTSSKNYYSILKLPQVVGNGGNESNLLNYIIKKIKNNQDIKVYHDTYKSIIDVEDVKKMIDIVLKKWYTKNTYISVPYIEKMTAHDIVQLVAKELKKKAIITLVESEPYDLPECKLIIPSLLNQLNIDPSGYTQKVIKKYAWTKYSQSE